MVALCLLLEIQEKQDFDWNSGGMFSAVPDTTEQLNSDTPLEHFHNHSTVCIICPHTQTDTNCQFHLYNADTSHFLKCLILFSRRIEEFHDSKKHWNFSQRFDDDKDL